MRRQFLVIAGPERKSRLISAEEKRVIAYHEAGHSVVMNTLPEADPVHKVTIIPRGMAGGYTMSLPQEDRTLMSRKKLISDMTGLMGGRAAEELVFDDYTSGAANDIERITKMARNMVTRLGMSEELGPLVYGQKEELIFLGREISEQRDYSEAIAEKIDQEVRRLVNDAHSQAKQILLDHRDKLEEIAIRLLEVETITREEFEKIYPIPFPKKSGTPVLLLDKL
jgi:cell division protease FtsH